ncbi:hypothetical protein V2J09_021091 [Rumex salicifolius]
MEICWFLLVHLLPFHLILSCYMKFWRVSVAQLKISPKPIGLAFHDALKLLLTRWLLPLKTLPLGSFCSFSLYSLLNLIGLILITSQGGKVAVRLRALHRPSESRENRALIKEVIKEGAGDSRSLEADDVGVRKKASLGELNSRQWMRKVSDGHFTAVSWVAPKNEETLRGLEKNHHHGPCPIIPPFGAKVETISDSKKVVLSRIKSFPKGTTCRRDGFRAQHLVNALGKVVVVVVDNLVTSIIIVVNLLLTSKSPSAFGEFIASALLTCLIKHGGGIPPIVVGMVATIVVGKEVEKYLEDFQLGVRVPNGGEAILHAVNRLIEAKGGAHNISMVLVDFNNAFNMIDRSIVLREVRRHCPSLSPWVKLCYARPTRLYYDEACLLSCQGVQQGDPLGPLLFALILHPLVHRINEDCNLDFMAWYLDDGTIIGDTILVLTALHLITKGPSMGLHLNVEKIEIFWPNPNPMSNDPMLFPQKWFGLGWSQVTWWPGQFGCRLL